MIIANMYIFNYHLIIYHYSKSLYFLNFIMVLKDFVNLNYY